MIWVGLPGIDLVVEGTVERVTDDAKLQRVADVYNAQGWDPKVKDGAFTARYSAPSAGPPPGTCTRSPRRPRSAWPLATRKARPAGASSTERKGRSLSRDSGAVPPAFWPSVGQCTGYEGLPARGGVTWHKR